MYDSKKVVSSGVRWIVVACAAYAVIGGGMTLLGWYSGLPGLTDWMASGISMFPNTAFAAFCAGAALLLTILDCRFKTAITRILGIIVGALGSATLFQHFSGIDLGIDNLLANTTWGTKAAVVPGRMGPPASVSYTLIGLALVFLGIRGGRVRRIVPALGICVCVMAVLALMGYASGADPLFAVAKYTGVAMQTATILLALGLGMIAAVPEYEPLRTLRAKSSAGTLARQSLPFIVVLPFVLGWIRVRGQAAGLYDTAMGTALLTVALVVIFCALLWWWVSVVATNEQEVGELNSELKQKLDEMTTLQEILPVGVWIGNRDCSEIHGNPAAYRILGLQNNINVSVTTQKPDLPRGLRIRVNGVEVPPEDSPMQSVARTGRPWNNFEHDITFPDGRTKVIYGSVAPLFDENGEVRKVIAAYADFSERKRAEEELRHRGQQLETLINRAPLGVYLVDADFCIAQVNPVALPVFGEIPGGVVGRDFDEIIHLFWEKNYADEVVRIFRHTLDTGESYFTPERAEYRVDRQDTEYYEWRLDRITLPDGRYGLVCYFRDISQQVEARKKLEESRDALRDSERVQRLIAQIGELGARMPETDELIGAICQRMALELGVSRCGYTVVDLSSGRLSVTSDYHGNLRSIAGVYPFSPYGEANQDAFAGRPTVNEDLATNPRTARDYPRLWAPLDFGACVSVPLHRHGQWAASFWVSHHEPRRWTASEIDLTKLVADRVWLVMERNRAENALRRSESLLSAVLKQLPVGLGVMDTDGQWIVSNAIMNAVAPNGIPSNISQHTMRWQAYEANGKAIPAEDWPGKRALRGDLVSPGQEMLFTDEDGREHWMRVSTAPLRDDAGQIIGATCVVQDITERKKAEEHQGCLAAIVENSEDAIISKTLDAIVTSWNPGAEALFGYTESEMTGRSIREIMPLECSSEEDMILLRLRAGKSTQRETVRVTKDGRQVPVSIMCSPIKDASGNVIGGAKIARDITEQKQTEEKLHDAQKKLLLHAAELEATVAERTAKLQDSVHELQAFSYSIAHDMRAPLRAMGTFAQLLMNEIPAASTASETRTYCERIVIGAARLDNLINDALNYTKAVLQEFQSEPVDLLRLVRGLVDTYPNLHMERANIAIEENLPTVHGNESLLTQCFSNLLRNAVKFVPPGIPPKVRVWSETVGGIARIWVEDSGIGISKFAQPRLFMMFQKLDDQYEGTGVGLAIVRKVVERMGGKVGVDSEPGRGSRFWVELRISPADDKI